MTREIAITVDLSAGEPELVAIAVDGHEVDIKTPRRWHLYRPAEDCADAVLKAVAPSEREDAVIDLADFEDAA
jgi:hypothetical protein